MSEKRNQKFFLHFTLPERFVNFMSSHSFPGVKEKSILQTVNIIVDGFKHSFLGMRASALSFKFIMAAIPALVILFIILSTLVPVDTNDLMFSMFSEFLPEEIFKTISKPIYEASNRSSSGILSIATITCLYFAVNSMRASMEIFNNTYHIHENRPLWKQFCVASLMVLIILCLLIFAMAAFVFNHNVLAWLNENHILSAYYTGTMFQFIKWTVFFLFMTFFLSVLYYMAPAKKNKFKLFSFGSVVASVFSFIIIRGFDFFITHFNRYNEIYGGLSALFILMLFVYILANIFLIGFEINVALSFGVKEEK